MVCAVLCACGGDAGEPNTNVGFEPPGGTFVDSVRLVLGANHDGAVVHYTLNDTPPTLSSPVYEAPITISQSTVVRALVVSESLGLGKAQTATYMQVEPDFAEFTSDLPVLLIHSAGPAPEEKRLERDLASLNVFEAAGGRTRVLGPAVVSERMGIKVRGSSSATFEKKLTPSRSTPVRRTTTTRWSCSVCPRSRTGT